MAKTELKKKLSLIHWALIVLVMMVLLLIGYFGIQFFSVQPLTLSGGSDIRGRLIPAQRVYRVGDLIPVTLEIEAKTGVNFEMPDLATADLGSLAIVAKGKLITERPRGGIRQTITYQLDGWEEGRHTVTGLSFAYTTASGAKKVYSVSPCTIKITSVLPAGKSEQELAALPIKAVKKPVGLPPRYFILWWFLGILAAAGLIYWGIQYWRRIRSKKGGMAGPEDVISREPAHIIALRRLEALQKQGYLEEGAFKPYYIELSECIREYLENRFQIRALEMTTEEFLMSLTTHQKLAQEHQNIITEFLTASDLVKFAKYLPLVEEANKAFALAKQLIEETKEEPVPSPEHGNNGIVATLSNRENQNDVS